VLYEKYLLALGIAWGLPYSFLILRNRFKSAFNPLLAMMLSQRIQSLLLMYGIELEEARMKLLERNLLWNGNPSFDPKQAVRDFKSSEGWENCLEKLVLLGFASQKGEDSNVERAFSYAEYLSAKRLDWISEASRQKLIQSSLERFKAAATRMGSRKLNDLKQSDQYHLGLVLFDMHMYEPSNGYLSAAREALERAMALGTYYDILAIQVGDLTNTALRKRLRYDILYAQILAEEALACKDLCLARRASGFLEKYKGVALADKPHFEISYLQAFGRVRLAEARLEHGNAQLNCAREAVLLMCEARESAICHYESRHGEIDALIAQARELIKP
jgi:hypothetical protein